MTKVSVVIPAYNVRDYIEKCISSLTEQTYHDIEIIVVDDGSNDGTGEMVDALSRADSRIRVYHTENRGVVAARKKGTQEAAGEYVCYVDADDWCEKDLISTMYESVTVNDAESAFTTRLFRDEYGMVHEAGGYLQSGQYSAREHNLDALLRNIHDRSRGMGITNYMCCGIYKNDSLLNELVNRLPEGMNSFEDEAFVWSYLALADSINVINIPLYHYVKRENSASFGREDHYLTNLDLKYHFIKEYFEQSQYADILMPQLRNKLNEDALRLKTCLGNREFHLFPYELIDRDEKIVLYGAGTVGQSYYYQILQNHYCRIILWADANYEKIQSRYLIRSPECIKNADFSRILVAIRFPQYAQTVREQLVRDYGISPDRIVTYQPIQLLDLLDPIENDSKK